MKDDKKVVLITGASSGIGLSTAKKFIEQGYIVYGIGRKIFELDGLNYIKLDLRDYEVVNNTIKEIVAKEGKIDIVISNAGLGISGPVEMAEVNEIKKIMDVNFLGSVNIVKAVLPYMRERQKGRIVCTSSVGSFVALPFQAFYSASKAALDTFVDATRSEVKAFGVEIFSVHPGDVSTGFTGARTKQPLDTDNPYATTCEKCVGQMEKDEQGGMSADYVADKIYKIATKKHYKLRNVIGPKYKLFTFLLNLMPRKMKEWAVRKMYF